jgi:hypothetical protein
MGNAKSNPTNPLRQRKVMRQAQSMIICDSARRRRSCKCSKQTLFICKLCQMRRYLAFAWPLRSITTAHWLVVRLESVCDPARFLVGCGTWDDADVQAVGLPLITPTPTLTKLVSTLIRWCTLTSSWMPVAGGGG